MSWKKILSGLLLAFVLVTIGFAFGKEVTLRRLRLQLPEEGLSTGGAPDAGSVPERSSPAVRVLYLHGTIRCPTCNGIEKTAREVVETEFAADWRAGRLVWQEADFQMREDLARRYEVTTSTLVVESARRSMESPPDFEKLEGVWERAGDAAALRRYIAEAIRKRLSGGGTGS